MLLDLLLDVGVIIGTIALAIAQIAFVCWLALFLLGGLLGLIMDPYYGLPEEKHRKKLESNRKT
jgi:hypothetical protein